MTLLKLKKEIKRPKMKIAIMCESPLLQKALQSFLKKYLTTTKNCDFIISDRKIDSNKPICLISQAQDAHIKKPFTRAQLILGVERFFKESQQNKEQITKPTEIDSELEKKIYQLTHRFAKAIIETIKEHYEKK